MKGIAMSGYGMDEDCVRARSRIQRSHRQARERCPTGANDPQRDEQGD